MKHPDGVARRTPSGLAALLELSFPFHEIIDFDTDFGLTAEHAANLTFFQVLSSRCVDALRKRNILYLLYEGRRVFEIKLHELSYFWFIHRLLTHVDEYRTRQGLIGAVFHSLGGRNYRPFSSVNRHGFEFVLVFDVILKR